MEVLFVGTKRPTKKRLKGLRMKTSEKKEVEKKEGN